jgi:hypothetical protein
VTPGQVYVKLLPDGEPKPLTKDSTSKMSPVFSADGSRIVYTVVSRNASAWDTWSVPTLGGEPKPWLLNASGLIWTAAGRLLFSEIKHGFPSRRRKRERKRKTYTCRRTTAA